MTRGGKPIFSLQRAILNIYGELFEGEPRARTGATEVKSSMATVN